MGHEMIYRIKNMGYGYIYSNRNAYGYWFSCNTYMYISICKIEDTYIYSTTDLQVGKKPRKEGKIYAAEDININISKLTFF